MSRSSAPPSADRRALVDDLLRAAHSGASAVVAGEPGAGKSAVAAQLAAELAAASRAENPAFSLVATSATAVIPLGVFLPLLDRPAPVFDAAAHLVASLADAHRVIIVDDAHLLDLASAGVLFAVAQERVSVVAFVRTPGRTPDAIEALTALPDARHAVLGPLSDAEIGHSLRRIAAAAPEPGAITALRRHTGGNARLVSRLIGALADGGRLIVEAGSVCVAPGPSPVVEGALHGIDLTPGALRAVHLVAVAGSVPLRSLQRLCPLAAVAEAEELGVVTCRDADGDLHVSISRPAVADSVRDALPVAGHREMLEALLRAVEPSDAQLPPGARRILWLAKLGEAVDPQDVLTAIITLGSSAPADADTLLDIAVSLSLAADDRVRLAGILAHRHRLDDAELVLAGLPGDPEPATARSRDLTRSLLLSFPGNDPRRAIAILTARADVATDAMVRAHLATAHLQAAEIARALTIASAVADDDGATTEARAHASLTVAAILVQTADAGRYEKRRRAHRRLIGAVGHALPEAGESTRLLDESMLLEVREALDAAHALAAAGYDDAAARGDEPARAQHGHLLARIALEHGAPQRALPLALAASVSEGMWGLTCRAWTTATYIEALALTGHLAEADLHLQRLRDRPRSPIYDIDVARAEAVVVAAHGRIDEAAAQLCRAGSAAIAREQLTRGRYALDQAVRFGSDEAARVLLRSSYRSGSEPVERRVRLARAWLDRDPAALELCARELAATGLLWRGLEVAALAAVLRPSHSSTTLGILRRRCAGLRSPTLDRLGGRGLTPRERTIVRHAASGLADSEIAALVGISVRTVQTHLTNAYHKLGIRGRAQLPPVIQVLPYVDPPLRSPKDDAGDSD